MKTAWPPADLAEWSKQFRFITPIQVRFSDTDMLGHINNVSYFSYFEHGRLAYLAELDLTPHLFQSGAERGGFIVTASLECQYLQQVHFGQEVQLGVRVNRIGNSSLDFIYALFLPAEEKIAAIGRGTVVYIHPTTGKSQPLPEKVKESIRTYEQI
ncbi:acyl-CoA thioesterase [Laceyella putida]|uniref:Acyl-CoA thioesterase n=1 Tax=Laceyella putida TaxID=110101 RepID=A0ABW2RJS3_9BACL